MPESDETSGVVHRVAGTGRAFIGSLHDGPMTEVGYLSQDGVTVEPGPSHGWAKTEEAARGTAMEAVAAGSVVVDGTTDVGVRYSVERNRSRTRIVKRFPDGAFQEVTAFGPDAAGQLWDSILAQMDGRAAAQVRAWYERWKTWATVDWPEPGPSVAERWFWHPDGGYTPPPEPPHVQVQDILDAEDYAEEARIRRWQLTKPYLDDDVLRKRDRAFEDEGRREEQRRRVQPYGDAVYRATVEQYRNVIDRLVEQIAADADVPVELLRWRDDGGR